MGYSSFGCCVLGTPVRSLVYMYMYIGQFSKHVTQNSAVQLMMISKVEQLRDIGLGIKVSNGGLNSKLAVSVSHMVFPIHNIQFFILLAQIYKC